MIMMRRKMIKNIMNECGMRVENIRVQILEERDPTPREQPLETALQIHNCI
jgi:hypothetical protein